MPQVDLDALFAVVDGFYSAAHGESTWQSAMQGMRAVFGATRACITQVGPTGFRFISQEADDDPRFASPEGLALYLHDPLAMAESSVPLGRAYGWHEIVDMGAFRRRALWHDFYGPMGLHDSLSCRLGGQGQAAFFLHITRDKTQEPFGTQDKRILDHLVPHLVRAGSMERSLAGTTLSASEHISSGIFVVDGSCRLHGMNAAGGEILAQHPAPLRLSDGYVSTGLSEDMSRFRELVEGVCRSGVLPAPGGALPLRSGGKDMPVEFVLHVAPLGGVSAFGLPAGRSALVTIRKVRTDAADRLIETLCAYFALTRAEARLVAQMVAGHSLRDAAARCGITFGTARNYLIRIFRKTGTHRQTGLLALALALGKDGIRA